MLLAFLYFVGSIAGSLAFALGRANFAYLPAGWDAWLLKLLLYGFVVNAAVVAIAYFVAAIAELLKALK